MLNHNIYRSRHTLDTFKKYRYSDIKEGRTEITDYDYDSSQYNDELEEQNK